MKHLSLMGLMCSLLLAACGSAPTAETSSVPADATQPEGAVISTQPADNTGLVARVNGIGISVLTFDTELARRSEGGVADAAAMEAQVLDGLIERELVRQAAREQNVAVSLDEARAEVDVLKASLSSEAEWTAYLELNGLTEPEMISAMMEQMTSARVRDALFESLYGEVPQANAQHILVATEAEAATLLGQLQQGADFADLARRYSIDNGTREDGGDLGWFTANELIDVRLADIVFSLEPGSIAGPIPSRVGYHIVMLNALETRPIEPERMGVLMDALYSEWLAERYALSAIERYR